jgi:hypothetical protein
MRVEIYGQDAISATEELLRISPNNHCHHCCYYCWNNDYWREALPMEGEVPEVSTRPKRGKD